MAAVGRPQNVLHNSEAPWMSTEFSSISPRCASSVWLSQRSLVCFRGPLWHFVGLYLRKSTAGPCNATGERCVIWQEVCVLANVITVLLRCFNLVLCKPSVRVLIFSRRKIWKVWGREQWLCAFCVLRNRIAFLSMVHGKSCSKHWEIWFQAFLLDFQGTLRWWLGVLWWCWDLVLSWWWLCVWLWWDFSCFSYEVLFCGNNILFLWWWGLVLLWWWLCVWWLKGLFCCGDDYTFDFLILMTVCCY